MEKIKLINKSTNVIKEINKNIASDYIGTGEFEIYNEVKKPIKKVTKKNND